MAVRDVVQAAAGALGEGENLYVEDVFSTYLYTGTGSTQVIENGIPLSNANSGGSVYFDGSGDYLSGIGTTSSFNFMHNTTALFTFECWVYVSSLASSRYLIDNTNGTSNQTGINISIGTDGKVYISITRSVTSSFVIGGASSTGTVSTNSWNHVAITYDQSLGSDNCKFYINGVASGTATKTGNTPSSSDASNAMRVGAYASGSGPFFGHISNLRITNSIVYTSAFTPSTTPLTAISGTSLLTCQGDSPFVDNSANAFAITQNGNVAAKSFGPFTSDVETDGGLVWFKSRSAAYGHGLVDTLRGVTNTLQSNNTNAQNALFPLNSYNSNGFTLAPDSYGYLFANQSGTTYASWTFRKAEKFFDVVTWTGNGTSQSINHNLGSTPGCIIVKGTSGSGRNWIVWHRSFASTTTGRLILNTTDAYTTSATYWNSTAPTSTQFTVGSNVNCNASGETFVAYLFAHEAGGFGDDGEQNVITCGSYTGNGSLTGPVIDLGWEPQWLLIKNASDVANWLLFDTMRGIPTGSVDALLLPNTDAAETANSNPNLDITATGFYTNSTSNTINASDNTYIYIAIRRGPMKTPESGTEVFAPVTYTGTNVDNRLVDTGLLTDMTMDRIRTVLSTGGFYVADRLRGNASLGTTLTDAENTDTDSFMTPTAGYGNSFSAMNGFGVGNDATRQLNGSSTSQLAYAFRRAPGFFDVVCYTGNGTYGRTVNHNLGVAPELILVKRRNNTASWGVYSKSLLSTDALLLNSASGAAALGLSFWNSTAPTSSVFSLGNSVSTNTTNGTYVAYLFATLEGVSKVGSYTGTGTTQQIDCGFTSGARFVLIKRTNTTGDWWVFDTARGIVAGNDPFLRLNTTDDETSADYIDTYSAGFELSSTAPAELNGSGDSFIFLAIA